MPEAFPDRPGAQLHAFGAHLAARSFDGYPPDEAWQPKTDAQMTTQLLAYVAELVRELKQAQNDHPVAAGHVAWLRCRQVVESRHLAELQNEIAYDSVFYMQDLGDERHPLYFDRLEHRLGRTGWWRDSGEQINELDHDNPEHVAAYQELVAWARRHNRRSWANQPTPRDCWDD